MSGWEHDLFSEGFDAAKTLRILIPSEAADLQRSRSRYAGRTFDKKRQANRESARRCRARKTRHVEIVVEKAGRLHQAKHRLIAEAKADALEIDALQQTLCRASAQLSMCEEEHKLLSVERDYLHGLLNATEGKQENSEKDFAGLQKPSQDHPHHIPESPALNSIPDSKVMVDEDLLAVFADLSELFVSPSLREEQTFLVSESEDIRHYLQEPFLGVGDL